MKTFVVLAVSIVLVSVLLCPMVMAFPAMPSDLQIVQPDPSLPKELSAFFGKWEGSDAEMRFLIIVEKIDEEKASLYWWQTAAPAVGMLEGWRRIEANVIKERGKYKLWWYGRFSPIELTLKGEDLNWSGRSAVGPVTMRFRRVP